MNSIPIHPDDYIKQGAYIGNLFDFINQQEYDELNILTNKFELSPTNRLYYIEDTKSHFMIIADMSAGLGEILSVNIFGKDIKIASEIYEMFKEYEYEHDEVDIIFSTVGLNNGKISDSRSRLKHKDFEDDVPDFYPYLDVEELFEQFARSNENILGQKNSNGLFVKSKEDMTEELLGFFPVIWEFIKNFVVFLFF